PSPAFRSPCQTAVASPIADMAAPYAGGCSSNSPSTCSSEKPGRSSQPVQPHIPSTTRSYLVWTGWRHFACSAAIRTCDGLAIYRHDLQLHQRSPSILASDRSFRFEVGSVEEGCKSASRQKSTNHFRLISASFQVDQDENGLEGGRDSGPVGNARRHGQLLASRIALPLGPRGRPLSLHRARSERGHFLLRVPWFIVRDMHGA